MQHLPGLADEAIAALTAGDPQALIDFHRLTFGGWRMEADDDADDQDDQSEDDADEDSEDDKLAPEDDPNDIAYWKKRSRQNEREAKRAKRERDEAKKAATAKPAKKADDGDDDDKPDVDKIREDAKAEARREALHGRVEDKIEAKARAFADPEDAVAVLLRTHDIEDFIDDDQIDVDAITEALGELAEKKPHLLAQGKKFEGDADGGARQTKTARPKDLGEAVSRRLSGSKK